MITWIEGDDHVRELHSQAQALYERVVRGNESCALSPMTQIHPVLRYDHLCSTDNLQNVKGSLMAAMHSVCLKTGLTWVYSMEKAESAYIGIPRALQKVGGDASLLPVVQLLADERRIFFQVGPALH